ncbi:MAG: phosphomannomutase/phosphoglucomutase [Pseudomonadota bacterium]
MAKRAKKRTSTSASRPITYLQGTLWAIGFAAIGLVVAFALVWWQAVTQPIQDQFEAEQNRLLGQYEGLFNSRVQELRELVNAMATAPATRTAMVSVEAGARGRQAEMLTAQHPYVRRVDLIPKDQAEVDLNAAVPISFAALDLIRRAETREYVGPEVSLNQRNLVYAAQPITPDGTVAGVLLVVLDAEFFLAAIRNYDASLGIIEIIQQFEGNPATTVIQWGTGDNIAAPVATSLQRAAHWQLSYAASRSALTPGDATNKLLVPFLVALALIIAGTYLGFSQFNRRLQKDVDQLIEYTNRILRGRNTQPPLLTTEPMQSIVAGLDQRAKKSEPALEPEPAGNDPDDFLAAAPASASPTNTSRRSESADNEDDFLDVSNHADDNFGIEVSESNGPADLGIDLDAEIFRAYDIRGITTTNLTEEVVYWVGRAFAAEARAQNQQRVAIGRDGRHSSAGLRDSLARGLTEGGVDVLDIGQVPTPVLYFATHALDTGTGIMITGSHNPPEYNGLKMMIGGVTLAEDAIQQLKTRLDTGDLSDGSGDVDVIDLDDAYVDRILEDVAVAQPLKVVVDCGNGVAGELAPRLLRELGCEVIPLYCEIDGDFPNHHPDPAEPKNLEDLQTVVQAESADLGLAFDGDGDRVGVVTPKGEIIWPDKLMMLFAEDIIGRNPGADIIYDVKCSRHLNNLISNSGGRPIMWKTGHSHIKAKIRETGALLAGEFSGHICFGERWYGFDDALYSAARLVEILGSDGRDADSIFDGYPKTFSTPELKINTTEAAKFDIMRKLEAEANFGDGTITNIDGIRVDFAEGWGLIRPSNTSPVLSLRFEADSPEVLDEIQEQFQAQLTKIDAALKFRSPRP